MFSKGICTSNCTQQNFKSCEIRSNWIAWNSCVSGRCWKVQSTGPRSVIREQKGICECFRLWSANSTGGQVKLRRPVLHFWRSIWNGRKVLRIFGNDSWKIRSVGEEFWKFELGNGGEFFGLEKISRKREIFEKGKFLKNQQFWGSRILVNR
jgi:hypothetical protein